MSQSLHLIFRILLGNIRMILGYWCESRVDILSFPLFSLLMVIISGLTIFTSLLYLYQMDDNLVQMKKSHFWILAWAILIFCPLVPIVLTLAYIWTKNEDIHHKARLSKCLAGFLDHGPHFVLRLVIVVLIGISHSGVYKRYVQNEW